MEERVFDKARLLLKSVWTNQDIMAYSGCCMTSASAIHQRAVIEHDGLIKLLPKKVKRDAVLKVLGVDPDEEIGRIKQIIEIMDKGKEKEKNENYTFGN